MFRAKIDVTLKKAVLDPQGKTVMTALHSLGFSQASDVRVGKFLDVKLDVPTEADAKKCVAEICDKLLVNVVIEDYAYTLEKISS